MFWVKERERGRPRFRSEGGREGGDERCNLSSLSFESEIAQLMMQASVKPRSKLDCNECADGCRCSLLLSSSLQKEWHGRRRRLRSFFPLQHCIPYDGDGDAAAVFWFAFPPRQRICSARPGSTAGQIDMHYHSTLVPIGLSYSLPVNV